MTNPTNVDSSANTQKSKKIRFNKSLLIQRAHLPDTDNLGMNKEPSRFNATVPPEPKSWRHAGDEL